MNRFSRRPGCASRPSADLAGRAVALSIDVPAVFDAPLAPHHKMLGRWAAAREAQPGSYTRHEARQHIERVFGEAVGGILKPFTLADLRVVAIVGDEGRPPALAIICDSIGQIDLGWIEKTNILAHTLAGPVAPVGWRAAAYRAIEATLGAALPFFGYAELFDEIAGYYWDGAIDDEGARATLIELHGAEPDDLNEMTLPSEMNDRRPDWMTAKAAPLKDMPSHVADALRRVRSAYAAVRALGDERHAWRVDRDHFDEYVQGREDSSHLPPLTIVPFDFFAREIDDVGRFGMEQGFDDVAGLCLLPDLAAVDRWFASLKLGGDLLLAIQALIELDPANSGNPQ